MNLIINFYKQKGIASNKALTQIKRLLKVKSAGFIGTLDPLAEGVLPVFTGTMTKLIPLFEEGNKSYRASLTLGYTSNTYDTEGEIVNHNPIKEITQNQVESALEDFKGKSMQEPPMYSAIKYQGKKLYQYALQGETIERKKRAIEITQINLDEYHFPKLTFSVLCSKGTYIRSIVNDLGNNLGTGAILTQLIRLAHGKYFFAQDAISLDELEKNFEEHSKSILDKLPTFFQNFHHIKLDTEHIPKGFYHGNEIEIDHKNIMLLEEKSNAAFLYDSVNLLAFGYLKLKPEKRVFFQPTKLLINY